MGWRLANVNMITGIEGVFHGVIYRKRNQKCLYRFFKEGVIVINRNEGPI